MYNSARIGSLIVAPIGPLIRCNSKVLPQFRGIQSFG